MGLRRHFGKINEKVPEGAGPETRVIELVKMSL